MNTTESEDIKQAIYEAFEALKARNELKEFIKAELMKAINEVRWITIHPHGEDSDDYRRLKIKDGETVEEAMHRQGYYNKRKAKDEKEQKQKEKETKIYTEENYNDFHKLYYQDNEHSWQFKKEKGNDFSVTRTDEKGNWVHYSNSFEKLDNYLNENDLIKAALPKTKVKGKDEYKEDEKTLNKFLDKGYKVAAKYDDGYEIKYILKKENPSKQLTSGQQNINSKKQDIENILKTEENKRNELLQLYKDYKKAERKYNKTKSKADLDTYIKIGEKVNNTAKEYRKSKDDTINYIKQNSKPLAKNADIAGVKVGKPMSFEQANKNKANPNYVNEPLDAKYNTNCQSCVLAYEARRRGYNVKALARNQFDKTALLAKDSAASLINSKTGKPCEYEKVKPTNASNLYNTLDKTIKNNERYFFVYSWFANGDNGRHVVTVEKDENNNLAIYDPQTGKRKYKDEMKQYFSSYLKFNGQSNIGILRADDKDFNEFFVNNGVLEKG